MSPLSTGSVVRVLGIPMMFPRRLNLVVMAYVVRRCTCPSPQCLERDDYVGCIWNDVIGMNIHLLFKRLECTIQESSISITNIWKAWSMVIMYNVQSPILQIGLSRYRIVFYWNDSTLDCVWPI